MSNEPKQQLDAYDLLHVVKKCRRIIFVPNNNFEFNICANLIYKNKNIFLHSIAGTLKSAKTCYRNCLATNSKFLEFCIERESISSSYVARISVINMTEKTAFEEIVSHFKFKHSINKRVSLREFVDYIRRFQK